MDETVPTRDEHFRKPSEDRLMETFMKHMKENSPSKVRIKMGELVGDPEKFKETFAYLAGNTDLENIKLKIKRVKAKVECMDCDWRGDPQITKHDVRCPRCRGDVNVLRGDEFSFHV